MRKIRSILCAVSCMGMFGMVGCTTEKTPVSAETFSEKMEEAGLTINDQSEEAPEDFGTSEVKVAFEEGQYQIEYYAFEKEEDAESIYSSMQGQLEDTYESANGTVKTSKNVGNYGSYKLSADGKYYVVSRIGNTLVYSATTSDYKNQVKKLVEDLGY